LRALVLYACTHGHTAKIASRVAEAVRQGGHPTDTSHDHDYTDWSALDRLGAEFAAALRS
jgi:menaquinone-dependent protoporphyrinogen IX oxidase